MASPPRKRKPRKTNAPASGTRPRARAAVAKTAAKAKPQLADSSTRATWVLNWLLRKLPAHRRGKALDYLVLTRMDRPIGALLLLWPTWWALWLASGDFPSWKLLLIFTLGVFVMRAAGCALNDYAEHLLDPQVARSAGRVRPREALVVFMVLLAIAFALALLTNRLTLQLALAGVTLAVVYPISKRFTYLPQVVLGAAFGWSIPMAFAAVTHTVPTLGWLLFIGNILWVTIYDTEYAMVEREDDLKPGANSSAILFGDADLPILGMLMGTFLLAMLFVGQRAQLGWPYWLALLVAVGLFGWQLWRIRRRARDACMAALRHNNWLGLTLWIGIVLALALG